MADTTPFKKELVTITCPQCQKEVLVWAYNGIIEGRCFVTNKQVSINLNKKKE